MNELIKVTYDNDRPAVSARDLHDFLEVKTAYKDWFPRMCEYGFTEGEDFCSFLSESTGGRPAQDAILTIDMAKELCMIQRNEKGKLARQYFIQIEKDWNSPEKIMARALFRPSVLQWIRRERRRRRTHDHTADSFLRFPTQRSRHFQNLKNAPARPEKCRAFCTAHEYFRQETT